MTRSKSWRAWSSTVRLVVDLDDAVEPAAARLKAILADVDQLVSRFRVDSVLTRVNRHAGKPVPVPHRFIDYADAAVRGANATDGLLDPTMGIALARWGYDRDINEILIDGPAVDPMLPTASWRDLRIDRELGLVTVPRGLALDLGATAKAHAADCAARALSREFGSAVLVELGGDLAVAGKRRGGWPIAVAEREGDEAEVVLLASGGMATSTTTIRRWRRGARDAHHILDPRTGAPAEGPWRTVSVAANSALEANIASTSSIIRGSDAPAWLESRDLSSRLIDRDGAIVVTGGWRYSYRWTDRVANAG